MGPRESRWVSDAAAASVFPPTKSGAEARVRKLCERVYPDANVRERAALVRACMEFRKSRDIRVLEKAANAMAARIGYRKRIADAHERLSEPCAFYAISTHRGPREEHRALQGTICYDRAYRGKIPWYLVRACERYIRDNDVPCVQDLMKAPVFLITARNCRHRLIPLDTREVLDGTAKTVYYDYGLATKTDAARYREYRDRRKRIERRLERRKRVAK